MLAGMVERVGVGAMIAITAQCSRRAGRVVKGLLVESIVDPHKEGVLEGSRKRSKQALKVRSPFGDVAFRVVVREIGICRAGSPFQNAVGCGHHDFVPLAP